jgi:hypothetical protein
MADMGSLKNNDSAVEFMVAAGLVFEIIAAACSSPQTTEINAATRADTLMKWVIIGMVMSAVFVLIAAMMSPNKWPPLLGGGLAGGMLWAAYAHAKSAGLASCLPGTESL